MNGLLPRKVVAESECARTKTDTGRQGENPKVREKTLVKELGKMHPKLRDKDDQKWWHKRGPSDCLAQTQVPAKSKDEV